MSPKSRGRPPGRGKPKKRGGGGSLSAADRVLRDAGGLVEEPLRLAAEETASAWLGGYWAAREPAPNPEEELIRDVIARARMRRGPAAIAALHALRLVVSATTREALDEAVEALAGEAPPFAAVPPSHPTGAWVGEDPWGSRQVLLVEYGGYTPHTLLADVAHLGGGSDVEELAILDPGLAQRWDEVMGSGEFPVVLEPAGVADALGQLAALLSITDEAPDRITAPEYAGLRALAHSRCAGVAPIEWESPELPEHRIAALVEEFRAGGGPAQDVAEAILWLLVEYGTDHLRHGPLAWTPDDVGIFLLDWLPDTVEMDPAAQAVALEVTRAWVRFALGKRGVDQRWIEVACAVPVEVAQEFAEVCAG